MAFTMNQKNITEALWRQCMQNLNSGPANDLQFSTIAKSVIGPEGVKILSDSYSAMIEAPVDIIDSANGAHFKLVPSKTAKGYKTIVKRTDVNGGKIVKDRRPANCFILYRAFHHPTLKQENPGMHNNEISKILGSRWRSETQEVKDRWHRAAEEAAKKHQSEHPNYRYTPRKSGQIRKRLTKAKKEAQAALINQVGDSGSAYEYDEDTQVPDYELPKTAYGNVVVELGNDTVDDLAFMDALYIYNSEKTLSSNVGPLISQISTPVIHHEPIEEAQNDFNFLHSMLHEEALEHHDNFLHTVTGTTGPVETAWDRMSLRDQQRAIHKENVHRWNAELIRMKSLEN